LRDSNFFTDRAKVEAVGESSDERITITAVGMDNFSVHITPPRARYPKINSVRTFLVTRRAVVRRNGIIRLWSRDGTDPTDKFPDVHKALEPTGPTTWRCG
jgi:hypothetical protein